MTTGHTEMRVDGGWTVWLAKPLKHSNGTTIDKIEIRPVDLDQVLRWNGGQVVSTLEMLSELCEVPEMLLRTMTYPDVDRVLLAYSQTIPHAIRKDFEEGTRQFATPDSELPAEAEQTVGDPVDPRFPKVAGVVNRMPDPPSGPPGKTPPQDEDDGGGISTMIPEAAKRVG